MLHYRLITAPTRLVHPDVRKTGLFTHVRANLRGDVSEKRFSMHVGEGNVARIGEGWCGNDKVTASACGEGWKASRVRMESG